MNADGPNDPARREARPLRVLLVEDSRTEAMLIVRTLQAGGFEPDWQRVVHLEELSASLEAQGWDVVLCDYTLPGYTALEALEVLGTKAPKTPVIVVSGMVGEEAAVECMRLGARDMVLKDRLHRLAPAIQRELLEARVHRERRLAQEALSTCLHFLTIANRQTELPALLEEWVGSLVEQTPLAVAGIRLMESDGGIVHQAHRGHSDSFLQPEGPPSEDQHPCFCSRILRGETGLPLEVTHHGSGWTADLSALAEEDRSAGERCGCADAGFRSLALVPIHIGDDPMGLILLADPRPDVVTGEIISLLEIIAVQLGVAVIRARTLAEVEENERLYHTLVELSPDAILVVDQASRVVAANAQAGRSYGSDDSAQLRGMHLKELMFAPRSDGLELADLLVEARSTGVEFIQQRLDGVFFPGEVHCAALGSSTMVSVRDMTERRDLQARLAQADRLASMGMLASGVAHEINNPLTYVLQNLEWMMPGLEGLNASAPLPGEEPLALAQVAKEALDGVSRVRKIMRDLRTFSRVEQSAVVPVLINDVLDVAITMAQGEVRSRARLVKLLDTVPPVLADEGQLAQVFLNLLINAAQATTGAIQDNEIEVRSREEDGDVVVSVRDTGVGILPEDLDRLFTPFFTTKEPGVGSGLGLAICQDLVRRCGGTIEVQSEPGQGAMFTVRFPALDRSTASDRPQRTSTGSLVRAGPRGRVLVVDDEPYILSSVRRLLRRHEVVTATGGLEAQDLLAEDSQFDVIFCDVMMPEGNGADLLRWLQQQDPKLAARLVFITGGACAPWVEEFLDQVEAPVLHKPLDTAELLELADRMVRADDD